jgi:uncharacterized protein YbjT (DUF2867 family)
MTRVLITGGRGTFGSALAPLLIDKGHTVRVMSHTSAAPQSANVEWAMADLTTGEGLTQAVAGVDVIVHAASGGQKNSQAVDVTGTRTLLERAREAGVSNVIYISIVGIDRVSLPYYQHKLTAEAIMRENIVSWSIVRITQFHNFIDLMVGMMTKSPIVFLPTQWQSQPIDVREAAAYLVPYVRSEPSGMIPEIGGPEVLKYGEMARLWMTARGVRKPMIPLPLPMRWSREFARGLATTPQRKVGKVTWAEWLARTYGDSSAAAKRPLQQAAKG